MLINVNARQGVNREGTIRDPVSCMLTNVTGPMKRALNAAIVKFL